MTKQSDYIVNSGINERIRNIRLHFFGEERGSHKSFCDAVGVKSNTASNWIKDGYSIGVDVILQLLKTFPAIEPGWLLTGEGEMIHKLRETEVNVEQSKTDEEELKKSSFHDEPKISYVTGVPYYNVDFIGGFNLVLNDQTVNPEYLIDFQKYNDATCWCNVTGHSMEPEITHGDIIAMKEIKDMSFLPLGEVYAIVTTNDMRTIKRLGGGDDEDHYNLVPTNKSPEYGIQPLPKRMIRVIYQVLGCMKRL